MHKEAQDWIFKCFHEWRKEKTELSVLEVGSLDINGSIKSIFEPFATRYVGIDVQEGPGVDMVAAGQGYWAPAEFDVIVTAETFEHTPDWKDIIKQCYINLKQDGLFVATMAGEGRPPHSALDQNPIRDWEHYANIGGWDLHHNLWMFKAKHVNILNTDTRCWAIK